MNRPFVLVLVIELVLDRPTWFRGRGRGRERERLGSWSQCAMLESWRLPMNLVAADVRLWLNSAFALCTPHLKSEPPHVGCYGSWSQCPANFLFPLKQRTIRWRWAFPAGGWSAWLSQQNTFMAKSMMRAVGVLPGKRAGRLIEHQAPKISATNQVKIRALDVGVCGTDCE